MTFWPEALRRNTGLLTPALLAALLAGGADAADFTVVDARPGGNDPAKLCVAALCFRPVAFDAATNSNTMEAMARAAVERGADLVVTPECALNGYAVDDVSRSEDSPQKRQLGEQLQNFAERTDGRRVQKFCELAAELQIYLVLGLYESSGANQYNSALLIDPQGQLLGTYRKVWRDHDRKGNEYPTGWGKKELPPNFRYGEEDYRIYDVGGVRTGLMICTERENPSVAERLAAAGAKLVVCPSFGAPENAQLMSQRSRENDIHTVLVNPYEAVIADRGGNVLLNEQRENVVCLQELPLTVPN